MNIKTCIAGLSLLLLVTVGCDPQWARFEEQQKSMTESDSVAGTGAAAGRALLILKEIKAENPTATYDGKTVNQYISDYEGLAGTYDSIRRLRTAKDDLEQGIDDINNACN